jgi:hypothetical protein
MHLCPLRFFLSLFNRILSTVEDAYRPMILWHIDPLLGNGHKISNYTSAVVK